MMYQVGQVYCYTSLLLTFALHKAIKTRAALGNLCPIYWTEAESTKSLAAPYRSAQFVVTALYGERYTCSSKAYTDVTEKISPNGREGVPVAWRGLYPVNWLGLRQT